MDWWRSAKGAFCSAEDSWSIQPVCDYPRGYAAKLKVSRVETEWLRKVTALVLFTLQFCQLHLRLPGIALRLPLTYTPEPLLTPPCFFFRWDSRSQPPDRQ